MVDPASNNHFRSQSFPQPAFIMSHARVFRYWKELFLRPPTVHGDVSGIQHLIRTCVGIGNLQMLHANGLSPRFKMLSWGAFYSCTVIPCYTPRSGRSRRMFLRIIIPSSPCGNGKVRRKGQMQSGSDNSVLEWETRAPGFWNFSCCSNRWRVSWTTHVYLANVATLHVEFIQIFHDFLCILSQLKELFDPKTNHVQYLYGRGRGTPLQRKEG